MILCLWGGVNGHLTVERGTPQQVTQEVQRSLEQFNRHPGFILSPVDNLCELSPLTVDNLRTLIATWRAGC